MFTQAMPAFVSAARGAIPTQALAPIMQSLGNCQQPLTHRGGINVLPAPAQSRNGVYSGGQWNPSQYPDLFPQAGSPQGVDIPGMTVNWNNGNRYDSQFFFPTNQYFTQNQLYGGPTFNIQGGANIEYITNQTFEGDTVQVRNLTTNVFNGDRVPGPAGPPGSPGRDGRDGAPGAPGRGFNAIPVGQFLPLNHLRGHSPRVSAGVPVKAADEHQYVTDAWVTPLQSFTIPTGVTFDADACAVTWTGTTTLLAASSGAASELLSASGGGVLIGLKTEATPTIQVCQTPTLDGVVQASARVFQQ